MLIEIFGFVDIQKITPLQLGQDLMSQKKMKKTILGITIKED